MNNIKIVTMALALMTTSVFSDFTIKDLFISGGTQTTEDSLDKKDSIKIVRDAKKHKNSQ